MPPDPPTSPPSCKYAPPFLLSDPHINRVARRWMDSKAYSRIGRTKTQLKSVFIATGSLDPNVLLIRPNNRLSLIWFEWLRRERFITRWNTSIAKFVKNTPLCVASYFQLSQSVFICWSASYVWYIYIYSCLQKFWTSQIYEHILAWSVNMVRCNLPIGKYCFLLI